MTLLLWIACSGPGGSGGVVPVAAAPIGEAECAVCGMMVGEQPSPRGQLQYRDGTHDHVCSIEELRALAQQRSAKGRPVGVFVEALPESFDVSSVDTVPLPWSSVEDTWFVFGAERRGVMGTPVLSFASEPAARRHAEVLGSRPVRWSLLEKTPFHAVPEGAAPNFP